MNRVRFACLVTLLAGLIWSAAPCVVQNVHAAEGGNGADQAEGPNPMAFDPDLAIFSAIVFLAVVFILGKYAWPTIAAALDERERKIADNIQAAETRNEEAKQLLVQYEQKLAEASGEVRELLEEARRDAEATKARIADEARKVADEEKTRAIREIERAKTGAIEQLANASADTAIDLARRVVREDLKTDRQSQLVREALGMLSSASGTSEN